MIFISYARENESEAHRLYFSLKESGLNPWIDKEYLLPGQNWIHEIKYAIKQCDTFIALLSKHSVNKVGFVQKELKQALDIMDEYPDSKIFVIPVRIEECCVLSDKLSKIHWVDMFPSWEEGFNKLLLSLKNPDTLKINQANIKDKDFPPKKNKSIKIKNYIFFALILILVFIFISYYSKLDIFNFTTTSDSEGNGHVTSTKLYTSSINSPELLLKTFYDRVEKREYDALYELIYPFEIEFNGQKYNYQDLMVEAVKRGDFHDAPFDLNYSHAVMKIIIDKHLDDFKPLPKKYLSLFANENSSFGSDMLLRRIAQSNPENLIYFEHNHMKVMIVKIKHVYKILFTEDMDNYFY